MVSAHEKEALEYLSGFVPGRKKIIPRLFPAYESSSGFEFFV